MEGFDSLGGENIPSAKLSSPGFLPRASIARMTTDAVPQRDDFPALRRITTRWADNDVYGHVNNVVYYSFFDTAVNGWLIDATGVDIRELPAIGLVAETSCRFLASLSFPEPVVAGLALERLGTSSVIYRIGLFRGEDSTPAALGRFVHVYVDARTRLTTPVPDRIRTALSALASDDDGTA
jgi:acyl-CoA thioester hydrolase